MAHTAAPDASTPAAPRLVEPRTRRSADRILLGVAGGFARRWRVDPTLLRAAVGLLALAGGIGVALYAVGIALSEPRPTTNGAPQEATPMQRRNFAVGLATLAVLLAARDIGLWPGNEVMIPASIVAVAVVVIWAPATGANGDNGGAVRRLAAVPVVRWVIGAILAIAGVAALADLTGGLRDVGRSVSAIAIALAGIGVIAAPALGRLLANLDTERTLRVREEERAALAAHLHDSVLQSLVLIQRADDPRRMVSLARRQERELRSWLYGAGSVGEPSSLTAAVESMAAAIEVDHEMRVEAVIVGDAPLDETARAFLGALREAATNAARHSGADHIDVYVEADVTELAGFVRDTGGGFDPAAVPADRHGIADSIVGRIDRAGGHVVVTSHPNEGTEVEIQLPRPRVMRVGQQT
jgi:signal transduction histidine kinase